MQSQRLVRTRSTKLETFAEGQVPEWAIELNARKLEIYAGTMQFVQS